jgi:hypothetical protein
MHGALVSMEINIAGIVMTSTYTLDWSCLLCELLNCIDLADQSKAGAAQAAGEHQEDETSL